MRALPADDHWTLRATACPVCGEHEAKFLGFRGGWAHRKGSGLAVAVVRCRTCETTYPNPTPVPRDGSHYEDAGAYFAEDMGAAVSLFETVLARAATLCGGPGRLLDVGCGLGESLVAARNCGWDSVGLEPSAPFAEEGRRRYGVEIEVAMLEPGRCSSGSFDLVLLSGVLEHVYDPIDLLELTREVLRPGGVVYVDVPNESSWFQEAGRLAHRLRGRQWCVALSPTFPPYHVVGFGPKAMRSAFGRAGLEVAALHCYPLSFASLGLPWPAVKVAAWIERGATVAGRSAGLVGWGRRPAAGG